MLTGECCCSYYTLRRAELQLPEPLALCNRSERVFFPFAVTVCHKRDPLTLFLSEDQDNVSPNTEVYLCLQHLFLFLAINMLPSLA